VGKKIVVIGGVACGPKAAARARRRDAAVEITVVERGPFVSYAGCGLPYYIGGVVEDLEGLMRNSFGTLRDLVYFDKVKNIRVLARTEALRIDRAKKTVRVKDLAGGKKSELDYDRLVLATGAVPVKPPIPGMELGNVFTLRHPQEAEVIRKKIEAGEADRVCIIGAGRVGLEVAEALSNQAVETTMVDVAPQVLTGVLDRDLAAVVARALRDEKVVLYLGEGVKSFAGEGGVVRKVVTDRREIETDAVIVAVGVRPEVTLAKEAGLELGRTGAILVDDHLRTSDPVIFAGGDCAENASLVTGEKVWAPLGSTANRHGRVIGDNVTGGDARFPGIVGTGVLRTLGLNVGGAGITEDKARQCGYDPISCLSPSGDKSHFYPGGKPIIVKLVADRKSGKLLGGQVIGPGDVVRRLDTIAAALTFGAGIAELADMDLCYAPPFGTAIEAVAHAANILRNRRDGLADPVGPFELQDLLAGGGDFLLLDVRGASELTTAGKIEDRRWRHVAMEDLRSVMPELPGNKPILVICQAGQRSYEAARTLRGAGFKDVRFAEGGMSVFLRIS
jgi:NADPH-dependent 2,4-dienoyl-CoA reductase/sulfur reductase-like enzyme/rhodanese-related sulfurtransferase